MDGGVRGKTPFSFGNKTVFNNLQLHARPIIQMMQSYLKLSGIKFYMRARKLIREVLEQPEV